MSWYITEIAPLFFVEKTFVVDGFIQRTWESEKDEVGILKMIALDQEFVEK